MKREYDFSQGERGKFYRPGAEFQLPVYLDRDVMEAVQAQARKKRMDTSKFTSKLLRSKLGMRTK